MAKTPSSAARDAVRDTVPKLVEVTENVLFGDIWERPGPVQARPQPDHLRGAGRDPIVPSS